MDKDLPKKIEQIGPHVLRALGVPDLDDSEVLEECDNPHKTELAQNLHRLSAFLQSYISPNAFLHSYSTLGPRTPDVDRERFLNTLKREEAYKSKSQWMKPEHLAVWRAYMLGVLIARAYGHESNPGRKTEIAGVVRVYEALPKLFVAKDHPELNGLDLALTELFTHDLTPARRVLAIHEQRTPVFLAREDIDVSTMYMQPEVLFNAGLDKSWKQKLDAVWANFEKAK